MDGTIRVRTAAWFATAVVISVFATLLVMQEWRADAAPGDSDATWVAVEPCRLFDYRPGEEPSGGKKDPLAAGAPATQQVTGTIGNCTIPTVGVVAVSMNVTVVQGTAQSNLRLCSADAASEPVVSNLNWKAGDSATANKVDVKLSATGAVKLAVADGTVNVIGDVVGYYTNTSLKELEALKADTADVNGALLNQRTWTAHVDKTGDKKGTGNFTSARTGVGVYDVIWDFTGLVLAKAFFNATATTQTLGCNAAITNRSITSVDGILTFSKLVVKTTNNAGSIADCSIFVMAMLQGPNVVTPPLSLPLAASLEAADETATATCSTDGDITTCVD